MSPIPTPPIEGYANYIAAIATVDESEMFPQSSLPLQLLKSLDDLDEEKDEDDDDEEIEDLDEEEDEDDLEDDYEDEDEDDEDEDEDDDEDDDEDGGVKPLKMAV